MNELDPILARWANFYFITSAAAATLIGLLFVVITLAAELRIGRVGGTAKIRAYLTPTVIYFASVLGIAALLTFPNHTRLTATLCICFVGIAGLVYSGSRLLVGNKKRYIAWQDIILYVALPFAAYGFIVLGGVQVLDAPQHGLTFVAIGMLSLLTIAIRNSWSIAIDVATNSPDTH